MTLREKSPSDRSRRAWLKPLLGLFALLFLAYCKTTRRSVRTPGPVKKDGPPPQPAIGGVPGEKTNTNSESDTDTDTNTGTDSTLSDCDKPIQINLGQYSDVTEALSTNLIFYGIPLSFMMVLTLPKYQHGLLAGVVVIGLPSGRVIAQKGIVPSVDIDAYQTLKPFVIDNLNLKTDKKVAILYRLTCNGCKSGREYKKFVMSADISFATTFNGKPVIDASPIAVPALFWPYQAQAYYWPESASLHSFDTGDIYQTAYKEVLVHVGGLADCTITDLAGRLVELGPDGLLPNPTDHTELIVYRLANDLYIRSFIRMV